MKIWPLHFSICNSKRSISEVQLMHNVREHKEMLDRQDWLQLKLNNIIIPSVNDSQKERKGKNNGPSVRHLRKGEGATWSFYWYCQKPSVFWKANELTSGQEGGHSKSQLKYTVVLGESPLIYLCFFNSIFIYLIYLIIVVIKIWKHNVQTLCRTHKGQCLNPVVDLCQVKFWFCV